MTENEVRALLPQEVKDSPVLVIAPMSKYWFMLAGQQGTVVLNVREFMLKKAPRLSFYEEMPKGWLSRATDTLALAEVKGILTGDKSYEERGLL